MCNVLWRQGCAYSSCSSVDMLSTPHVKRGSERVRDDAHGLAWSVYHLVATPRCHDVSWPVAPPHNSELSAKPQGPVAWKRAALERAHSLPGQEHGRKAHKAKRPRGQNQSR